MSRDARTVAELRVRRELERFMHCLEHLDSGCSNYISHSKSIKSNSLRKKKKKTFLTALYSFAEVRRHGMYLSRLQGSGERPTLSLLVESGYLRKTLSGR